MQFVGKFISTVSEFYKDINPATLSGAIDVVVIEQPDGTLACSPFHVRFGKLQVLSLQNVHIVNIAVNGIKQPFTMRMGEGGEAYFIREPPHVVTRHSGPSSSDPSRSESDSRSGYSGSDNEFSATSSIDGNGTEAKLSELSRDMATNIDNLTVLDLNAPSQNMDGQMKMQKDTLTSSDRAEETSISPEYRMDNQIRSADTEVPNISTETNAALSSSPAGERFDSIHSGSPYNNWSREEKSKSWIGTSNVYVKTSELSETQQEIPPTPPENIDFKPRSEEVDVITSPLSDTELEELKKLEKSSIKSSRGWRAWFSRSSRSRSKPQVELDRLNRRGGQSNPAEDSDTASVVGLRSRSVEEVIFV